MLDVFRRERGHAFQLLVQCHTLLQRCHATVQYCQCVRQLRLQQCPHLGPDVVQDLHPRFGIGHAP